MKRYKLCSILVVMLVSTLLFAGCTKADSANLFDCKKLYDATVTKYYVSQTDIATAQTADKDNYIFSGTYNEDQKVTNYFVDLYTQNAYCNTIFEEIEKDDSADKKMNFGLLKKGNEFETIATISLQYFEKRKTDIDQTTLQILEQNGTKVPQSEYSKLYVAIEKLADSCKVLVNKKTNFVTSCCGQINQSSALQSSHFEAFVDAYKNLIGTTLEISQIYQRIDSKYFNHIDTQNLTTIPDGELTRLVDSAILYCASAYFAKYIKNAISTPVAFAHEGVDQDVNFSSFKADILNKYSGAISDSQSESDDIALFQVASKKLGAVVDDFAKYDDALAKIASYLKKNNLTKIDESRQDYFEVSQYCQFANLYENSIVNLQGVVIDYVAKG